MITLKNYLTASGRYPEREHDKELTKELLTNAEKLLKQVNNFLIELGVDPSSLTVSSGFRPSAVNASTPGSAKKSLHMQCLAIDIADPDGSLDELIDKNDALKKKYSLWQESPKHSPKWVHLDLKDRGKREKNTFIP